MSKALTRNRIWTARAIAVTADAVQIWLLPLFALGAPEPADLALEVVTGALLCWLCGFHPAFLPTVVGEALPVIDLFPSWTLATLFVTRNAPVLPETPPAPHDAKR